jgi:DNA-binding transcriptional LysR family regulator
VERHEIEIFLTLAEELHFGRTAERLHVSGALVSQTIKKLERRIGAPLFERTSRRVALTPIGQRLHEDLQPAYQRIQEAVRRAIAAGRGVHGVLQVGFMSVALGQLALDIADTFHTQHPDCEVTIRETSLADFLGPLRRGEVDVMLLPFPIDEPDLSCGPVLFSEPAMLAVSSDSPLAGQESACLEDLAHHPVLFVAGPPDYWMDHHHPRTTPVGRPVDRRLDFPGFQEILTYVAANKGVAVVGAQVTRYYARPAITCLPIRDAPAYDYGLVWRTANETSRVRAFTQAATTASTVASMDAPAGQTISGRPDMDRLEPGLL